MFQLKSCNKPKAIYVEYKGNKYNKTIYKFKIALLLNTDSENQDQRLEGGRLPTLRIF